MTASRRQQQRGGKMLGNTPLWAARCALCHMRSSAQSGAHLNEKALCLALCGSCAGALGGAAVILATCAACLASSWMTSSTAGLQQAEERMQHLLSGHERQGSMLGEHRPSMTMFDTTGKAQETCYALCRQPAILWRLQCTWQNRILFAAPGVLVVVPAALHEVSVLRRHTARHVGALAPVQHREQQRRHEHARIRRSA